MKKYRLISDDNYLLSIHSFDVEKPKAVIQIIHGMEEHQERYKNFARFLNKSGYTVVSSDLRGHGNTASYLGFFKEKDGYKALITDQIKIRKFISEIYPGTPVYLFAHSMGTIISRVLLQTHSKYYEKVILSGYPNFQAAAYFGLFFSRIIKSFKGAKYKSKFLQQLTVGIFNNSITNPETDVDWICHNKATVKSYINDPYCGIGFTCSAFEDLYHLVLKMHRPEHYKNINKSMPILLIRGLDDPCVGKTKGARDSYLTLANAGFTNISRINYKNMRHEILNEINNKKVYLDIVRFYDKQSCPATGNA